MMCTKLQVDSSKTVTGRFLTIIIHTDIHTDGSAEDRNSGNHVKSKIPRHAQYWLVNSTDL